MKKIIRYSGIFCLSALLLFSDEKEEQAIKRVQSHLFIADPQSAVFEAQNQLKNYPESKPLQMALLKAFSESGREVEALEIWKRLTSVDSQLQFDRYCLENLAWGVLYQGSKSTQLMVQLNALIGTAMTKDARAIGVLMRYLKGSNALLRSMAVSLAAQYGDEPLIQEIVRLFREEKIWYVRLEILKAIGHLRIQHLKYDLQDIIANPKTLAEEKAQAIIALVNMYDDVKEEELRYLIRSDRAGLRELACQIIQHLDLYDQLIMLIPLLKDANSSVKIAALNTLGLLNVERVGPHLVVDKITPLFKDASIDVAVTAAWVGLLKGSKEARELLQSWVLSSDAEKSRLASAALSISGAEGVKLATTLIKQSEDLYVKINLSLGLIGQRQELSLACDTLYSILQKEEQILWMLQSTLNPLFRSLAPSQVKHIPQIPNYPVVVDQLTRLNLLMTLCMLRYPKAEDAVKAFLQNHTWGATGAAALTLIREGETEALEIIRHLLSDPEEKVRMQAALLLALIGNDQEAVKVLRELYYTVDRQMKLQILEVMANVADRDSISFLLKVLNEPFQVLRVASASALIQCLNH